AGKGGVRGGGGRQTPPRPCRHNRSGALWFRARRSVAKVPSVPLPSRGAARIVASSERGAYSRGEDIMNDLWRRVAHAGLSAVAVWIVTGATASLGEECKNRGQL